MKFLIIEIFLCLLAASLLGLIIGWLCKSAFSRRKLRKREAEWDTRYKDLEAEHHSAVDAYENERNQLGAQISSLETQKKTLNSSLEANKSAVHKAHIEVQQLSKKQKDTQDRLQKMLTDKDREISSLQRQQEENRKLQAEIRKGKDNPPKPFGVSKSKPKPKSEPTPIPNTSSTIGGKPDSLADSTLNFKPGTQARHEDLDQTQLLDSTGANTGTGANKGSNAGSGTGSNSGFFKGSNANVNTGFNTGAHISSNTDANTNLGQNTAPNPTAGSGNKPVTASPEEPARGYTDPLRDATTGDREDRIRNVIGTQPTQQPSQNESFAFGESSSSSSDFGTSANDTLDDTTVLHDADREVTERISAPLEEAVRMDSTGNHSGFETGNHTGNRNSSNTGEYVTNDTGDYTGNYTGNHTGNETGDATGNETAGYHNETGEQRRKKSLWDRVKSSVSKTVDKTKL